MSDEIATFDPPLKWAGGKRWLVPTLLDLWQPHRDRRLVDPFVGGMAVPLGLRPQKALVSDINPHLMNFYRWVQQGFVAKMGMRNEEEFYYWTRDRFNLLVQQGEIWCQELAELFYYMNRNGFNGLCRYNQSGEFNVPFGRYTTINYQKDFSGYKQAMSGWELWHGDFTSLTLHPSDFIYADPPYDSVNDEGFVNFSSGGFSWEDQEKLARWLAAHPGPAIASNAYTERIVNLYRGLGFDVRVLKAPRRISSDGNRDDVWEVLAIK